MTPLSQVDVEAFASRAEEWSDARDAHRDAADELAVELAEDARQAELARLAAEEAARTTTTTTRPPSTTTAPPATTTTRPPTTTTTTTRPPTTTAPPDTATEAVAAGAPTAAQWTVLRQCESSGNYGAVSANQRYRGAYQFSQATWDWIAGAADPDQVGVDPAAAPPGVQDAMALALWERQSWSPWPICGAAAAAA